MDPYLEAPDLWPDMHHRLMTCIGDELAAQLTPRYIVRIEERVLPMDDDDPAIQVLIPDVSIHESGRSYQRPEPACLTAPTCSAPIVLLEEFREYFIEIRSRRGDRVVTVIEVLSPANKTPGSESCRSYNAERLTLLRSDSHLVEIDLLRAGERPGPVDARQPQAEYRITVSAVGKRPVADYWHVRLRDRLPTIGVPLAGDDRPAALDLQAVLADVYDRAHYEIQVDYREPPPLPNLPPKDRVWLRALLRQKGLR
jgi:hypothetical protein